MSQELSKSGQTIWSTRKLHFFIPFHRNPPHACSHGADAVARAHEFGKSHTTVSTSEDEAHANKKFGLIDCLASSSVAEGMMQSSS